MDAIKNLISSYNVLILLIILHNRQTIKFPVMMCYFYFLHNSQNN